MPQQLRVVILKPSKYGKDGFVERFRRGFMPNSTLNHINGMTPFCIEGCTIDAVMVDEYVQTDLRYLEDIRHPQMPTLLALVGVQSHQFQRALDLAAFAKTHGVQHCVIGGPHPMTCDTSLFHGPGVSFALAEAETIWHEILKDAIQDELKPVYGETRRWTQKVDTPAFRPQLRGKNRYVMPMAGVYPARGCPFTCNFCSVIKIAGRQVRSQSVEITIQALHELKAAGVKLVMFTSDNFNKYADAPELLQRMIEENLNLPFFVQCDTQIVKQEEFVELLARAGCFQMFVGVESFNRQTLLQAHKAQNYPQTYAEIVRLCRRYKIASHFSNIIGFPNDTLGTIEEHKRMLKELDPDVVSYYILCPIPGTEQYAEFLEGNLITEQNLDRFDGTCVTWKHPHIPSAELQKQLFECYRGFYDTRKIGRILRSNLHLSGFVPATGYPLFARYCAFKGLHPMSGGIWRVKEDSAKDYEALRQSVFGIGSAPLPRNLELSAKDQELNKQVRLVV